MSQIRAEVEAQQASSEHGAKARILGMKEIDLLLLTNRYEMNGDRAALNGHPVTAERWYRRADRKYKVYFRAGKKTDREFRLAGFKANR